jgi:hypothetical protein
MTDGGIDPVTGQIDRLRMVNPPECVTLWQHPITHKAHVASHSV